MIIKEKKDFLVNVAYWAFILMVVYLLFKYLLPITIPFILGYCIAFVVVKISNKIKTNSKIIRLIITILFYGIIGLVGTLVILKGFTSVYKFVLNIPDIYEQQIAPIINVIYNKVIKIIEQSDYDMKDTIKLVSDHMFSALNNLIAAASKIIVSNVSNIVKAVPVLFLSALAMIISTFFFVFDYEKMGEFIQEYVPQKWKARGNSAKLYITNTLFVVIRSYALIMLLTFSELSILFLVFGINNAGILAGTIAVFDIMPILGTGGIMIPWAIISFVLGDTILGIKLIIIYGIVTVIRNYVEPKIVGAQLGLHPIITLVSMFIGLRLFGFFGMFGIPITISFLWKKVKEEKKKDS